MALYSPSFSVHQYETREEINPFVSPDQQSAITDVTLRVPAQLDWLAQLLGWNGKNYWSSLATTVDQKRQLLSGTFGVYNSYIFPEIVEVRNWENSIIVKYNPYIQANQRFLLGDFTYTASSVTQQGDKIVITFPSLSDQFYDDLQGNKQLKAICPSALPAPFRRTDVGISADYSFSCQVSGNSITLYPSYDSNKKLPFVFNSLFAGSRYFFDLPVVLYLTDTSFIAPTYSFETATWYIDIPCNLTENSSGISAKLEYQDSFLIVGILPWVDPSDWNKDKVLQYFAGTWSNKGGPLPFHFTFDALSLHGFDEKKSVYLPAFSRQIDFDTLLNFVYQQRTDIGATPPPITKKAQVWWNSQTGHFQIHSDDLYNCGPWVNCQYPQEPLQGALSDYVFPDPTSFSAYTGDIPVGSTVTLVNGSGLNSFYNILGITQPLVGNFQVSFFKPEDQNGWVLLNFVYPDEPTFSLDAEALPSGVPVHVTDSSGMAETGVDYTIANLRFTIADPYKTSLMKSEQSGMWYLEPPSSLRYIGDTRLFQSSQDYNNPVEGEMYWEFTESNPNSRTAAIYYYNRWEYNVILSKWELKGDWVNINSGLLSGPPPQAVNFGAVNVYCNGDLLVDGDSYVTENFQLTYFTDPVSGKFDFSYDPKTYLGRVHPPRVTISDSLTSSYTFDISELVFSGLTYYASPNIQDSETLLRLWKSSPLFSVNDAEEITQLSYPNGLIADQNSGPADIHWERYFIRLPPSYQREGESWQKINLIAQDFAYWGSPTLPEQMSCPEKNEKPSIYEEVYLSRGESSNPTCVYAEPFWYSNVISEFESGEDFDNSSILPAYDNPYDQFEEGQLIEYDPLHERRADTSAPVGKGYGDWKGSYFRIAECSSLNGHLVNDITSESLESVSPPIWDTSIYKIPQTCLLDEGSGEVDANHFKIGYAFFCADLSAAGEAVFNFG